MSAGKSQMINEALRVTTHPVTGYTHVETINDDPSETQQQWAEDCDINNIMKKYNNNPAYVQGNPGTYADVSNIPDYQGMLDTIQRADDDFMKLTAQTRARFNNSPHELIQFLQNPNNHDEGVKLGLINPKQTPPTLNNDNLNDDHKYEEITTTITKKPRTK